MKNKYGIIKSYLLFACVGVDKLKGVQGVSLEAGGYTRSHLTEMLMKIV